MLDLLLMPIELFIGVGIGFHVGDKRQGFSLREFKIASIAFFIVGGFMMFGAEQLSFGLFLQLFVGLAILFIGVFIGDYLAAHLIGKTVGKSVKKRDVQLVIFDFLRQAERVANGACTKCDTTEMFDKLDNVTSHIERLKSHLSEDESKLSKENLSIIADSCHTLSRISVMICNGKKDLKNKFVSLANELSHITWDALTETEKQVEMKLQRSSIKVVSYAMKMQK